MIRALIYLDEQNIKSSVELLEVIERMYPKESKEISAVIFGEAKKSVMGYFDELHQFEVNDSQRYNVRFMASYTEKLVRQKHCSCIVIPATYIGRMLAPVLAMKLHTGLVADVVEVSNVDGEIQLIRPAFDGKLMACITNQNSEIVMMSARPGVFHYHGTAEKKTLVIKHQVTEVQKQQVQFIECINKEEQKDIRDARVLVSGGGGVIDNFQTLQELADLLGAMVSSSRRLVDSGVTSRSIQVGQSGKIVSPQLYIALGIYGALQHIEGLNNVKYIISVNTNKNAPICSLSQIVVEGDAIEFIDKLSEKIKKES